MPFQQHAAVMQQLPSMVVDHSRSLLKQACILGFQTPTAPIRIVHTPKSFSKRALTCSYPLIDMPPRADAPTADDGHLAACQAVHVPQGSISLLPQWLPTQATSLCARGAL